MLKFREKRKLKQLLYSKITLGAFFIIAVLLTGSVFDVYKKEKRTRIIKNRQQQELVELKDREVALRVEIDRLNSNIGIEEEIRSKFEVGRAGEGVAVITNPADTTLEETKSKTRGFLGKVLDIFSRN